MNLSNIFLPVFSFLKTGTKYFTSLSWLVKDAIKDHRLSSFGVIISNFIGVSTGVAAFSLIVSFIKYRIEGKVISFKGIKLPEPPPGIEGLLVVGGIALLIGLISASLIYISKWGTLRICKSYHKICILKFIEIMSKNNSPPKETIPFILPKHGLHHIPTIYCRYVAFTYRFFLEVTLPLITLTFSLCALIFLDYVVALSLLPFSIVYFFPIYKLNRFSAKTQGLYLKYIGDFVPWIRRINHNLNGCGNQNIKNNISQLFFKSNELENLTSSLYNRILLTFSTDFLSRLFLVICMVWLFFIFGIQVVKDERSWLSILTFIIALRFTGSSLQQVVAKFINISRFYPAVDAYRKFATFYLLENKKIQNTKTVNNTKKHVSITGPKIDGSKVNEEINTGEASIIFIAPPLSIVKIDKLLNKSFSFDFNSVLLNATYNINDNPIAELKVRENILGIKTNEELVQKIINIFDDSRC